MTTSILSQHVEALLTSLTAMVEQAVERAMERRQPVSTQPLPGDEQLVPVAEAAKRLGLSTSTTYRLAERVELASVKIGGRLLFRVADLAAFAERHRRSPELVARLAAGRYRDR